MVLSLPILIPLLSIDNRRRWTYLNLPMIHIRPSGSVQVRRSHYSAYKRAPSQLNLDQINGLLGLTYLCPRYWCYWDNIPSFDPVQKQKMESVRVSKGEEKVRQRQPDEMKSQHKRSIVGYILPQWRDVAQSMCQHSSPGNTMEPKIQMEPSQVIIITHQQNNLE